MLVQKPPIPNRVVNSERWRDRLQYSCRLAGAMTIADFTYMSLPPQLSWLYDALRPIRLVGKFGR